MKVQLHSIEQAPRQVPDWRLLMDDLCQPPPARVARALGLGLRTVQRYNRTGAAPRVVCLAVFWLTSWGRNAVHTQAHNDAALLAGYVGSLRRELDDLRGQLGGRDVFEAAAIGTNGGAHTADNNNFTGHRNSFVCKKCL